VKESRRHNPVKSTRKKDKDDEGENEDGWDATLVQFRAKLPNLVRDEQRAGWLSLEMSLAVRIANTIKEDLERSVSHIFYCVLVHRFTDFAIPTTAAPGH